MGMEIIGRRRVLFAGSTGSAAVGVFVIVRVTSYLEELGYSSSDATAAMSSLTGQLEVSIESGRLRENLILSGSKLPTNAFSNVRVVTYTTSDVSVTPLDTLAPTGSPTIRIPVPFSLIGMESTEMMLVFLPIVALLLILVFLLVCCCRHREYAESNYIHKTTLFDAQEIDGSDSSDEEIVVIDVIDSKSESSGIRQNSFKIPQQFDAIARPSNPYYDDLSSWSPSSFRDRKSSSGVHHTTEVFPQADFVKPPIFTIPKNKKESNFSPPKLKHSKSSRYRTNFDNDEESGLARL
jgi:hypothetical protein